MAEQPKERTADTFSTLAVAREISRSISSTFSTVCAIAFVVSFLYNWGFFTALGVSFDTAPVGMVDYAKSWVAWLPAFLLLAFGVLVSDIWSSHKTLTDAIGLGDRDSSSSGKPVQNRGTAGLVSLSLALMGLAFLIALATFRIVGIGEQSLIEFSLGISMIWLAFVWWVLKFPRPNAKYGNFGVALITLAPIFSLFSFSYGHSSVDSSILGQHDYYQIQFVDRRSSDVQDNEIQSPKVEPFKVQIIRIFEKWMVTRTEDGRIAWFRLDLVKSFDLDGNAMSP